MLDNTSNKPVEFKVSFEEGSKSRSNSRDVDKVSSLTSRSNNPNQVYLKVIKPNHLSNIFSRIEREAAIRTGQFVNSSSMLINLVAPTISEPVTKNLFGSRLEDSSSSTLRQPVSKNISKDDEYETKFTNDAPFRSIKAVVDRLESKGLINANGELKHEARVDDFYAIINPRLEAMIDWASNINIHWLENSQKKKYLSQLNNRCKLVSLIYDLLIQHSSMSDKLAVSDIMNSKIAYNVWRGMKSYEYPSAPKTVMSLSTSLIRPQERRLMSKVASSSIAGDSSIKKNEAAKQTKAQAKARGDTNAMPESSEVNGSGVAAEASAGTAISAETTTPIKAPRSSFMNLEVPLDTTADKELIDMVINELTAKQSSVERNQIVDHDKFQLVVSIPNNGKQPQQRERNNSEYIENLADLILDSVQSILKTNLLVFDQLSKEKTLQLISRVANKQAWLKSLTSSSNIFEKLRNILVEVFTKYTSNQQECLPIILNSIISKFDLFEIQLHEYESRTNAPQSENFPSLLSILNDFKIVLFDILSVWILENVELETLRRLLQVDTVILVNYSNKNVDVIGREPRSRNLIVKPVDFKEVHWAPLNVKRALSDESDELSNYYKSQKPTKRTRKSLSDDESSKQEFSTMPKLSQMPASANESMLPKTPRLDHSLSSMDDIHVLSFARLIGKSTPLISPLSTLTSLHLPLTPRMRDDNDDTDDDDFLEVRLNQPTPKENGIEETVEKHMLRFQDIEPNERNELVNTAKSLLNPILDTLSNLYDLKLLYGGKSEESI